MIHRTKWVCCIECNSTEMSSQEYKVRQAMVNINCNEPLFFHYNVLVNKFSGGCYDIYNPYAKLCVPDVVRDMNIK